MGFRTLEYASVEQAWEALARHVTPGRRETISLDGACGRVLAAGVQTRHDFPPFHRSMMDGYAVRSADFQAGPATLKLVGLVRAGDSGEQTLRAGECLRINTGAPLPPGADAVVIVEKSEQLPDGTVRLDDRPSPGACTQARASLTHAGDTVAPAGVRIRPGTAAAIASGGVSEIEVYVRPRVAILSTGDELAEQGETLGAGQIHDSNSLLLRALVEADGGIVVTQRRSPDEAAALRAALEEGLQADLLCVVGGMSKGTHDLVPGTLVELGVEWLVNGMRLKPGRPTRIGRAPSGCWVIGLPGNPVSCGVCYLLFARMIVARLAGTDMPRFAHVDARLTADAPANGDRPMYHPARWSVDSGGIAVEPLGWHGSGDPFGLAVADALIHRPANAAAVTAGEPVPILLFDWPQ